MKNSSCLEFSKVNKKHFVFLLYLIRRSAPPSPSGEGIWSSLYGMTISEKHNGLPRAGRHLCRHPDAKQTGKRENRHRKVLALFLRRFSFYCARKNSPSVPQASCGKKPLLQIRQTSHTGSREELPGAGCGAAEALRRGKRMKSSGAGYRGRRAPCLV